MPQKTSPYVESKYGWDFGESGWNVGADENFIKFGFLHDSNIDGIVDSLPAAVNGKAYYLTTDKRIYFANNSTYLSTPLPKWFNIKIRSTGQSYIFDGLNLLESPSTSQIEDDLDSLEESVNQRIDLLETDLNEELAGKIEKPQSPPDVGDVLSWDGSTWISTAPQVAASNILLYSSFPTDPPFNQLFMVVDNILPVVTAFTLQNNTYSPISVTSFEASDNIGVTAWWLGQSSSTPTLSDSGWSLSKPTSYITSSLGSTTVYARVRDAAGNISNAVSQTINITVSPYYDIAWPYNAARDTSLFSVAAGSFTNNTAVPVTPDQNLSIKSVMMAMRKQVESAYPGQGTVQLQIRQGSITGTVLSTSTTPVFTSATVETKTFTLPANLSLAAGTTYYLVFSLINASGGDALYRLLGDPSKGTTLTQFNGGAWTTVTGQIPVRLEKV